MVALWSLTAAGRKESRNLLVLALNERSRWDPSRREAQASRATHSGWRGSRLILASFLPAAVGKTSLGVGRSLLAMRAAVLAICSNRSVSVFRALFKKHTWLKTIVLSTTDR